MNFLPNADVGLWTTTETWLRFFGPRGFENLFSPLWTDQTTILTKTMFADLTPIEFSWWSSTNKQHSLAKFRKTENSKITLLNYQTFKFFSTLDPVDMKTRPLSVLKIQLKSKILETCILKSSRNRRFKNLNFRVRIVILKFQNFEILEFCDFVIAQISENLELKF